MKKEHNTAITTAVETAPLLQVITDLTKLQDIITALNFDERAPRVIVQQAKIMANLLKVKADLFGENTKCKTALAPAEMKLVSKIYLCFRIFVDHAEIFTECDPALRNLDDIVMYYAFYGEKQEDCPIVKEAIRKSKGA